MIEHIVAVKDGRVLLVEAQAEPPKPWSSEGLPRPRIVEDLQPLGGTLEDAKRKMGKIASGNYVKTTNTEE